MPGLGASYPRQISVNGSTRFPFALGVVSQLTTCGTLCFATDAGDFWIYLNGTDPLTPMFGGYTEILTNPGGGVALTTAVAKAPLGFTHQQRDENLTLLGTQRISSSISVAAADKPAFGLMWGSGANISYLFVKGTPGELRFGTEAEWQAGTGTLLATKAPSGKFDIRKDARSYVAGNDRPGITLPAVALVSGGRGAALVLASGDQTAAVALYTSDGLALTGSSYPAWWAWTRS